MLALVIGLHMKDDPMTLLSKTLLAVLATAGCETFKGAGRDLQGAGSTVTTTAAEVQADL